MIEPGDGWRFREHLLDLPLLQDHVVEHVLTGHQAVRRVFSDEVCRDATAIEAVREQIVQSSAVRHPGLQRYYKIETINKHLALTMELVQGTTLKTLTLAHSFKAPARWAAHARLVVRLLRSLSREGIAIECVRLRDLVFIGGTLRLASHQPVSPHSAPGDSAVLNALRQVPATGAYSRGDAPPRPAEWKHLMTALYFMASGQVERDIPAAYEFFTGQSHSHSHLGIEAPIESLLLRFSDETNPEAAWHWDDLLSGIEQLSQRTDKHAAAHRVVGKPPPTSASSRHKVSESDASVEQVRFSLQPLEKPVAQPVVIAPKSAPSIQEVAEAEARTATTLPPEPPPAEQTAPRVRDEVFTRDEMRMPGRLTMDEDAEEDRNYLYPSGSTSEAVKKSGTIALRKRRISRRRILVVGGGAVGLMLLVGVVYAVINVIATSGRTVNQPPVAFIAPIEGSYPAFETIPLDGTPSTDPDGDELTYNWSVLDLNRGQQYLIEPNNSRNAARTSLRIYEAGEYTVQLRVFDSALSSEPVTTTVRVTPPRLRAR